MITFHVASREPAYLDALRREAAEAGVPIVMLATAVGMGVHPFGDPSITDEFVRPELPIDAREFHDYAVEWTPDHVAFFVDGGLAQV